MNSMLDAKQYLKRSGRRKKVIIETPDLTPCEGIKDRIFDLFNDQELGIEVIQVLPATHQAEILKSIDLHISTCRLAELLSPASPMQFRSARFWMC